MSGRKHALVIVESPAKARTIAGYLGDGYVVEPSIGHIRDLPKSADDVPLAMKKLEWAKLGVDVQNDFKPLYVVDADKRQQIAKLKSLLKDASTLYLATDEDREGEAIAWHLSEVLQPKIPTKRMVFHEITKKAIHEALEAPREIDRRLVDAQEARRILDRLYGYEVSPVLWKKVLPRLSAGRVQSVATRVVVERERERMAFVKASWWDLSGTLKKEGAAPELSEVPASLAAVEGKRLATGKDFDEKGRLGKESLVLGAAEAEALAAALIGRDFTVRSVERKPYKRTPNAPFMTSTLQQEASRKLRFSAQRTMKAAQRLYEQGLITYMRTDSTTLSEAALSAARTRIEALYGREYLPAAPRTYQNKVKNAQEAHEAIRPAGEAWPLPEEVAAQVGPDEAKVYELVWKRTVASQMQDARGESVQVRFDGATAAGKKVELSASGNTIEFPGYLRAYVEGSDDPEAELEGREKHLPPLKEGDVLAGLGFAAEGHETQPPARYTEASLVRRLEELGVGRPSTYASTISTIQDRGYVWRKGTALVPSFTAFAVIGLLEKHFPELVDYAFTAKMEDDLDSIANGEERVVPWLKRFYFGGDASASGLPKELGLKALVSGENLGNIDARAVNSIPLGKDEEGNEVVGRVGQHGPYLQRGNDKVSIPEDTPPDELTVARALELLSQPKKERRLGIEPATQLPVTVKVGRNGPYVQLGEMPKDAPKGAKGAKKGKKKGKAAENEPAKPKTASLFKSMSVETLTLEEALKLLSQPRTVGTAEDGEVVIAKNGPFGPYVQKGKETRSLEREEQIFDVTMEDALKLLAAPKDRRRRAAGPAKGPLKELGEDPVSKKTIQLKDGRFGPYVTDGDTIASLRRGDAVDSITPERAQELLAERRERGPSTKKGRGRGSKAPRGKKGASLTEQVEKLVEAAGEAPAPAKKKTAARARAKKPS